MSLVPFDDFLCYCHSLPLEKYCLQIVSFEAYRCSLAAEKSYVKADLPFSAAFQLHLIVFLGGETFFGCHHAVQLLAQV